MNVSHKLHGVVGVAFGDERVEHPDELATHSYNGLLLFQRVLASGSVVLTQLTELLVAVFTNQ